MVQSRQERREGDPKGLLAAVDLARRRAPPRADRGLLARPPATTPLASPPRRAAESEIDQPGILDAALAGHGRLTRARGDEDFLSIRDPTARW
jgi:hypothetical protein